GRGSDLIVGDYRILDRLGAGGMGQVFKAEHRWLRRTVALKILASHPIAPPSNGKTRHSEGESINGVPMTQFQFPQAIDVALFKKEIRTIARLQHPHLVTAFDAGRHGPVWFLASEYLEGIDLKKLVSRTGPLPVPLACEYLRQAALGLQYLHENGLVHCDIKPTNILVTGIQLHPEGGLPEAASQGAVKILDLGLACSVADLASPRGRNPTAYRAGMCGTPDFMAPELSENDRAADIRADLYSLGCTLYFLLTAQ